MPLCGALDIKTGYYCTEECVVIQDNDKSAYHRGAHVARSLDGTILSKWNRKKDDHQNRSERDAENQLR